MEQDDIAISRFASLITHGEELNAILLWPKLEVILPCEGIGRELADIKNRLRDMVGDDVRLIGDPTYPTNETVKFTLAAPSDYIIDEVNDILTTLFGDITNGINENNWNFLPPAPPPAAVAAEAHDAMVCSISMEVMTEPVVLQCGHSFEKASIVDWRVNKSTCPLCARDITDMYPNIALLQIINDWRERNHI
eukprot:gene20673-26803_t